MVRRGWILTGNGTNSNEGIQHTVATTAGTQYTLSFWVGNVYDTPGAAGFGTTGTAIVLINGVQAGAFTNTTNAKTQSWQQFSLNFTATGASTTIAFVNGDPALDDHNGLDNVTLVGGAPPPASSVSAPTLSQWAAMLLAGLLALIGVARVLRARGRA
ncbi:MAG: IPTL-CTERM sorting domain-containing protein [Rudaea sp.]|uniref:IPTL-CTERM sorting domain-containing protein n=1 Tax=Rudaea sp. TaxID=2136325 RepID=UPI0039E70B1F